MKKVLSVLSLLLMTSLASAQNAPTTTPKPNPVFTPKNMLVSGICATSSDMDDMVHSAGYEILTFGVSEMDKTKVEMFFYNARINNFTIIEFDINTKEACMIVSGVNMVLRQKNAEKFYNDMTHSKTAEER